VTAAGRALLARVVEAGSLARDDAPVGAGELGALMERVAGHDGAIGAIDRLLGPGPGEALLVALDPAVLLEGARGRDVLQKGIVLLRHRRYPEAAEWWALNRSALPAAEGRLALVLLAMEALTWSLAGEVDRARDARARVKEHPMYRELRGKLSNSGGQRR
jgi:hypothetical protein